jgi:hypothetical protein
VHRRESWQNDGSVDLGVDPQSESVVVQFRPPDAFRDLPGFRAK